MITKRKSRTKTLISVDLDWLNGQPDPISRLKALLQHIPRNIPAIITIEHHEFLPPLRRWIESEEVPTPFNVINFDQHHDYYGETPCSPNYLNQITCGNWGYHLPLDWYRRYTWVHSKCRNDADWEIAKTWLDEQNIKYSARGEHRLSQLGSEIVAAVFCVSPDYLSHTMRDYIVNAVKLVARHFKLAEAPTTVKKVSIYKLNGWQIAPRPMRMKK